MFRISKKQQQQQQHYLSEKTLTPPSEFLTPTKEWNGKSTPTALPTTIPILEKDPLTECDEKCEQQKIEMERKIKLREGLEHIDDYLTSILQQGDTDSDDEQQHRDNAFFPSTAAMRERRALSQELETWAAAVSSKSNEFSIENTFIGRLTEIRQEKGIPDLMTSFKTNLKDVTTYCEDIIQVIHSVCDGKAETEATNWILRTKLKSLTEMLEDNPVEELRELILKKQEMISILQRQRDVTAMRTTHKIDSVEGDRTDALVRVDEIKAQNYQLQCQLSSIREELKRVRREMTSHVNKEIEDRMKKAKEAAEASRIAAENRSRRLNKDSLKASRSYSFIKRPKQRNCSIQATPETTTTASSDDQIVEQQHIEMESEVVANRIELQTLSAAMKWIRIMHRIRFSRRWVQEKIISCLWKARNSINCAKALKQSQEHEQKISILETQLQASKELLSQLREHVQAHSSERQLESEKQVLSNDLDVERSRRMHVQRELSEYRESSISKYQLSEYIQMIGTTLRKSFYPLKSMKLQLSAWSPSLNDRSIFKAFDALISATSQVLRKGGQALTDKVWVTADVQTNESSSNPLYLSLVDNSDAVSEFRSLEEETPMRSMLKLDSGIPDFSSQVGNSPLDFASPLVNIGSPIFNTGDASLNSEAAGSLMNSTASASQPLMSDFEKSVAAFVDVDPVVAVHSTFDSSPQEIPEEKTAVSRLSVSMRKFPLPTGKHSGSVVSVNREMESSYRSLSCVKISQNDVIDQTTQTELDEVKTEDKNTETISIRTTVEELMDNVNNHNSTITTTTTTTTTNSTNNNKRVSHISTSTDLNPPINDDMLFELKSQLIQPLETKLRLAAEYTFTPTARHFESKNKKLGKSLTRITIKKIIVRIKLSRLINYVILIGNLGTTDSTKNEIEALRWCYQLAVQQQYGILQQRKLLLDLVLRNLDTEVDHHFALLPNNNSIQIINKLRSVKSIQTAAIGTTFPITLNNSPKVSVPMIGRDNCYKEYMQVRKYEGISFSNIVPTGYTCRDKSEALREARTIANKTPPLGQEMLRKSLKIPIPPSSIKKKRRNVRFVEAIMINGPVKRGKWKIPSPE